MCDAKITAKGGNVGISSCTFFKNQNDDPELLSEVAEWWIVKHKLDHFEKAVAMRTLLLKDEDK